MYETRFEKLNALMSKVFEELETIIRKEAKDVDRIDISSVVGKFIREGNNITFTISDNEYTIYGQLLIFNKAVHFKTERNNIPFSDLSFLAKPASQDNEDDTIQVKDKIDLFRYGLMEYSSILFREVKNAEDEILKIYKEPWPSIV